MCYICNDEVRARVVAGVAPEHEAVVCGDAVARDILTTISNAQDTQPWVRIITEHATKHLLGEPIDHLMRFTAELDGDAAIHQAPLLDPQDILSAHMDHARIYLKGNDLSNLIRFSAEYKGDELVTVATLEVPIQRGMLGRTDAPLTRRETRLDSDEVAMVMCCDGKGEHEHPEYEEDDCGCVIADCECVVSHSSMYQKCSNCGSCEKCCDTCFDCESCDERKSSGTRCSACEDCEDCCSNNGYCFTCENCVGRETVEDNYCTMCRVCRRCCACWECDSCHIIQSEDGHQCGECNRCLDCCNCASDNRDGYLLDFISRPLQFYDSSRLQFKRNPLRRHISVEIEVDEVNNTAAAATIKAAVDKWQDSVVEDGSLSGDAAHEVNTMPTNGDRFLDHIKDLTDGYAQVGACCGSDTGLHVHIDCKDLKFYDMRKVLALYARTERALFELVGAHRLNETYSKICGHNYLNMSTDPRVFKRQLLSTLYSMGGVMFKSSKETRELINKGKATKGEGLRDHSLRYRALNIHSYFHRGSIEFRHHEGTVDYDEIVNWSLVCGNLIESAAKMSEAQIMKLPSDPHTALLAILPETLHSYCVNKWKPFMVAATLCRAAHVEYETTNEVIWRSYSVLRGNLPEEETEAPQNPRVSIRAIQSVPSTVWHPSVPSYASILQEEV